MLKKIIIITILALTISVPVMAASFQVEEEPGVNSGGSGGVPTIQQVNISPNRVPTVIYNLAVWFYRIILLVSVFFGLSAAYKIMSDKGDSKNVEKGRQQLIYAIVGIALAFVSFSITKIVTDLLK